MTYLYNIVAFLTQSRAVIQVELYWNHAPKTCSWTAFTESGEHLMQMIGLSSLESTPPVPSSALQPQKNDL